MVLGSRRDATATPRSALANRERDTTPRGAAGARSRVFPRADAAPALAHPDPDLDGDSDESSDNSLASTASDDTDDGGDPRRGFSDGFSRSQLLRTCQSKKQHLWNAVAETGRHASATRTPHPEPDGVRSLTDITAATVESATGPARPESPEDPRRRPRDDDGDGDSCAPTPEGATTGEATPLRRRREPTRRGRESPSSPSRAASPRAATARASERTATGSAAGVFLRRLFVLPRLSPSAAPHARRGRRIRRVRSRRGRWWMRDAIGDVHDTRRVRERRRRGASQSDGEPFAYKSRECASWSRRGAVRARTHVRRRARARTTPRISRVRGRDRRETTGGETHVARAETHLTLCWTRENAIWVDQFADAYEWVNGRPLQMPANVSGVAEYLRDVMARTAQMYRAVDPSTGRERLAVTLGLADGPAERDRERICRECGGVNPRHNTKSCHACEAIRTW